MFLRVFITTLFLIEFVRNYGEGARILGIFAFQGHSHWIVYKPLMVALAEKGHDVTVLGHFPLKTPIPRYVDINLNGTMPIVINNVTFEAVRDMQNYGNFMTAPVIWEEGIDLCEVLFETDQIQKFLKSDAKFDLIIIEVFSTECFLGFVHKYKVPYIGLTSSVVLPWTYDTLDIPNNPSYIPNYLLPFNGRMNLLERLSNVIVQIGTHLGYELLSRRPSEKIARRYFPDMPSVKTLANNISLLITNSHFSINGAIPGVPALVEVGGIHIGELNPLPKDLQQILDTANDGAIYFSFGSMVNIDTFPQEVVKAFIKSFSNVPQKILWKVNEKNLPKPLPENIIAREWLPQLEILCHSNTIAFITHGGLLGLQEAVHCGVPAIGIPLFADQALNIKNFISKGNVVELVVDDLTEEAIFNALEEVKKPAYKENAKLMSKLFADRLTSPLETAIYWTEYVLRYNGAPQLRTTAKYLSWYQLYLLDVLFIFVLMIFMIFKLVQLTIKLVFRKSKKTKLKSN